jgi:hypothetical protein
LLVDVEQVTEMLLAKDYHVIEAVAPDGFNQPLSILPRGSSRNRAIPYAHCCEAPNESLAIGAIAITNHIAWRLTPAAGFGASWVVAVHTPLSDKISRYTFEGCDWKGLLEFIERIVNALLESWARRWK